MKRAVFLIMTMFPGASGFAQDASQAAPKTFWDDPFNHPLLPYFVVIGFIAVVTLLVLTVSIYVIRILNVLTIQAEKEKAEKLGIAYLPKPTWWDNIAQRLNAAVPVSQEKDIELDHNYDGIRELDNHLPPWWKWLFYATIVFAGVYVVLYHFSDSLPLQEDEYQAQIIEAEETKRKFLASQPQSAIDEATLTYSADPAILEKGKSVFTGNNCGGCHRDDGGGNNIGPNLTDQYWLHGGDVKEVFNTVKNGVVDKGMPAWGKSMSPQDVRDVTFYILSLQGTNPANAKAPQGQLSTPKVTADSVKQAAL